MVGAVTMEERQGWREKTGFVVTYRSLCEQYNPHWQVKNHEPPSFLRARCDVTIPYRRQRDHAHVKAVQKPEIRLRLAKDRSSTEEIQHDHEEVFEYPCHVVQLQPFGHSCV